MAPRTRVGFVHVLFLSFLLTAGMACRQLGPFEARFAAPTPQSLQFLPQGTHPSATPTFSPTATTKAATIPRGWHSIEPLSQGPLRLHRLHMVDEHQGWALGTVGNAGPRVLITDDGAHTWREVSPPSLPSTTNADLIQTLFWDANTAWIAYGYKATDPTQIEPGVWVTHDRGTTWRWAPIPWPADIAMPHFRPGPLTAVDENRAWMLVHLDAGMGQDYALLVATTDGGGSWHILATPDSDEASDLMLMFTSGLAFAPDGRYGWATKEMGPLPAALVVVTQDGGRSWRATPFSPLPPEAAENEAFCSTRDPHLWAPGQGVMLALCLLQAHPEGYTVFVVPWKDGEPQARRLIDAPPAEDAQLTFPTAKEGYLVVYTGASTNGEGTTLTQRSYLFTSNDGGSTWEPQRPLPWRGLFSWLPGGRGWALADDGHTVRLVRTTDQGRSWEMLPQPRLILPAGGDGP